VIFKLFKFQFSFCKSRFAQFNVVSPLSKDQLYAVGAQAFCKVLKSKQPKYDQVVGRLKALSSKLGTIKDFMKTLEARGPDKV
jgi:hypothetical protein